MKLLAKAPALAMALSMVACSGAWASDMPKDEYFRYWVGAWASDMPEDEWHRYWWAGSCHYAYFYAGKADYAEQVRAEVKAAAVSKESAEAAWEVAEIFWTGYAAWAVKLNPTMLGNDDFYDDVRKAVIDHDCHKYLPD